MTQAIIVDIDGTVTNNDHRKHFVDREDPADRDWKSFNSLMAEDKPVRPIIDLLWHIRLANPSTLENMEILYATGRHEEFRNTTRFWLDHTAGAPIAPIYMRSDGDFRPDTIVKEELLARIIAEGYRPIMAIDDRKSVVDMWRRKGLICLQCAVGDF